VDARTIGKVVVSDTAASEKPSLLTVNWQYHKRPMGIRSLEDIGKIVIHRHDKA
jgi:hypothetical protein